MDNNTNTYSNDKVIKHYDKYSEELQAPEKTIYEILKPKLSEIKMLDIGVGGGRTTLYFASKVKEYTAIDFSKGMIDVCKEKFKTTIPSAKFEVGDVRDLSQYATAYFDLVLFSFNGLDNISHEERQQALKEIKRICSPTGIFCFSSHNIQNLPDFFKVRYRWHPIKFIKSIYYRKKLLTQNKNQIKQMNSADYVTIYDDVYDFGLFTYYVRPSYQINELEKVGFTNIRLFELEKGEELISPNQYDSNTDSWIYFLCRLS